MDVADRVLAITLEASSLTTTAKGSISGEQSFTSRLVVSEEPHVGHSHHPRKTLCEVFPVAASLDPERDRHG
jgi:hypothetical protein